MWQIIYFPKPKRDWYSLVRNGGAFPCYQNSETHSTAQDLKTWSSDEDKEGEVSSEFWTEPSVSIGRWSCLSVRWSLNWTEEKLQLPTGVERWSRQAISPVNERPAIRIIDDSIATANQSQDHGSSRKWLISHFSFPSSSSSVVNGGWAGLSKRRFLAYLPFHRFQAGCRRLIPLPQSLPAVLSNFRVVFTRFPALFFSLSFLEDSKRSPANQVKKSWK